MKNSLKITQTSCEDIMKLFDYRCYKSYRSNNVRLYVQMLGLYVGKFGY